MRALHEKKSKQYKHCKKYFQNSKMATIESDDTIFERGRWLWFQVFGTEQQLQDFWEKFENARCIHYAHAQFEETETEGLHIRGYAYSNNKLAPTTVRTLFQQTNNTYGNLKTQSQIENMRKRCHKEENRRDDLNPLEFGEEPAGWGGKKQEKTKNLNVEELLTMFNVGKTMLEVRTWAHQAGFSLQVMESAVKTHRYGQKLRIMNELFESAKFVKWKPWQQYLVEYMKKPAHPREILVVVDTKGNAGKTFFMKNFKILDEEKTVILSNARTRDLMYIVEKKPILENILYNLSRSVHGKINYQALEQLKDGEFTTTKYQGSEITLNPPRMVVFTNEPLNWDSMSKDRWKIMTINDEEFTIQNYTEYKLMGGKDGVKSNTNMDQIEPI